MKKLIYLGALCSLLQAGAQAQSTPAGAQESKGSLTLPNGWRLSPAGRSLPLGDLPLNLAVSRSGKWIAATNNGQGVQSIQLIDARAEKLLDAAVIPKSWYGLKFSADEKYLYASGGNDNRILKYALSGGRLQLADSIVLGPKWPEKIAPAGIALDDAAQLLYVVTRENNSLYIVDLQTKTTLHRLPLGAEAYTCLLSPDKKTLYVSLWGADKVVAVDTKERRIVSEIAVGDNPNELLLDKKGRRLYVANANDNSVSVIDRKQGKVIEVLNAALYPDAPAGSTSNGLALSANEKTLYIANADNNSLAVFDVHEPGRSRSKGFIPVGWYPTNVKVVGKKIFVSNGKGFSSFANPGGPNPVNRRQKVTYQKGDSTAERKVQYIAGLMKGTLSIIDEPSENALEGYTRAVYANTPYTKEKELLATGEAGNPIPKKVGDPSPIKYVFYIIKENRTYDQVLSDVPGGNGDTSLLLFGEKITPNQHALAREFVLLDNFYADGEVSADGHNWSTSAHATDYLEKTWPTSYGGRGGTYSGEGNRAIANPKKGFIWDFCKRAGVTYRTYGEFADNYKANIPSLVGHFCPYFTPWDQTVRDTARFYQWRREFDSLVAAGAVPRFNSLRFINDHTEGLKVARPTPFAHVADNDWAVGLFVEHLSKSPIWKESAVFIVEDDAQNGPDHVDAHRTTAYVAGGFVKRKFVDHTMYSTSSMLRTIELILGLPPMSQYDAAATPMWRCFTATPDRTPFTALSPRVDLAEVNKKLTPSARLSQTFDFSQEDKVPDLLFSQVIWKAVKGEASEMPAPRRSAFFKAGAEEEDDD
ncbi:bifunctional YncE family protein/alkaline phosphatase family protein [Paraflavisolibacter sp. H34]|uniref:bifunctional YncE family protein/alkaline phosphatase family protein n=1 Tax=Huijunlia imazamoxiresistens TaxID=3127457 RepID=UPI003018A77C